MAPAMLRASSQALASWFDIYARGVYQDLLCVRDLPHIACRGVGLADFGDIGVDLSTVSDLFREVELFVASRLAPRRIKPVFIGALRRILAHPLRLAMLCVKSSVGAPATSASTWMCSRLRLRTDRCRRRQVPG